MATERNGLIYTATSRNVIAALNASTGEIGMPTKCANTKFSTTGHWINTDCFHLEWRQLMETPVSGFKLNDEGS